MSIDLWPFQDEDITKLEPIHGALIAWEMGAGKTVGAIARDIRIRKAFGPTGRPTLVIAPLGTLESWARHFRSMTPLKVHVIDRKNRAKTYHALEGGEECPYHVKRAVRIPTSSQGAGVGRATRSTDDRQSSNLLDIVPRTFRTKTDAMRFAERTFGDSTASSSKSTNDVSRKPTDVANSAVAKPSDSSSSTATRQVGSEASSATPATNSLNVSTTLQKSYSDSKCTCEADVILLHWEALRLMPALQQVQWLHIIADECQRAKNRKAKQTVALKKLKHVEYKTAMSGTPLVNEPAELWSVLNWLYPKVFTSYWRFFKDYVDYKKNVQGYFEVLGPKNLDHLHEMMEDFYVRRRKADVMKDLPDKYYTPMYVDLEPKQRRAYDQMKKDLIAWVGEHQHEPLVAPVVISQLMRLQQFALGYLEWNEDKGGWVMAEPSAKLDALMELIDDNPDETFLVFSQFKSPLTLLKRRLDKKGIKYGSITGDDSAAERQDAIDRLADGRARIVVGTIGAGGVGIDGLQRACSTVVFLDRAWSPASNIQAEDRLHRGGQDNAVQVIDIIARNTVDLGRKQRLEQKWEWIKAVLGD